MMNQKAMAASDRRGVDRVNKLKRLKSVDRRRYSVSLVYSGSYDSKSPSQIRQNLHAAAAMDFAHLFFLALIKHFDESKVFYPRSHLLGGMSLFTEFERVTKNSDVTLFIISKDIADNDWFSWLSQITMRRDYSQGNVFCIQICLADVDTDFLIHNIDYVLTKQVIHLRDDYTSVEQLAESEDFDFILRSIENIQVQCVSVEEEGSICEAIDESEDGYALSSSFSIDSRDTGCLPLANGLSVEVDRNGFDVKPMAVPENDRRVMSYNREVPEPSVNRGISNEITDFPTQVADQPEGPMNITSRSTPDTNSSCPVQVTRNDSSAPDLKDENQSFNNSNLYFTIPLLVAAFGIGLLFGNYRSGR